MSFDFFTVPACCGAQFLKQSGKITFPAGFSHNIKALNDYHAPGTTGLNFLLIDKAYTTSDEIEHLLIEKWKSVVVFNDLGKGKQLFVIYGEKGKRLEDCENLLKQVKEHRAMSAKRRREDGLNVYSDKDCGPPIYSNDFGGENVSLINGFNDGSYSLFTPKYFERRMKRSIESSHRHMFLITNKSQQYSYGKIIENLGFKLHGVGHNINYCNKIYRPLHLYTLVK